MRNKTEGLLALIYIVSSCEIKFICYVLKVNGSCREICILSFTLGKFVFNYTCTVVHHGDSQWRTHRACLVIRKFTHSL